MAECLLGTKAPNPLPSPLMFFKDSDLFQDELQLCWKYPCNSDSADPGSIQGVTPVLSTPEAT